MKLTDRILETMWRVQHQRDVLKQRIHYIHDREELNRMIVKNMALSVAWVRLHDAYQKRLV